MGSVGIIAFAFGQQQGDTPKAGLTNLAIGFTTEQIAQKLECTGNTVLVATQWEVAAANQLTEYRETHLVSAFKTETHYVPTKKVLDASLAYFKERGVKHVVIVAHPLHRAVILTLIKTYVWPVGTLRRSETQRFKIWMDAINYDRSPGNTQWWTRNPFAFALYLGRAMVIGHHGS